jgi:hypothetical protein
MFANIVFDIPKFLHIDKHINAQVIIYKHINAQIVLILISYAKTRPICILICKIIFVSMKQVGTIFYLFNDKTRPINLLLHPINLFLHPVNRYILFESFARVGYISLKAR